MTNARRAKDAAEGVRPGMDSYAEDLKLRDHCG
jgi:hypothetical protein